jgi:sec-independent protein translocase protein TatA
MGIGEILLIMVIALILFGPEELPEIARKIGKVVFEIRNATNELTKEFKSSIDTPVNVVNKVFDQTPSSLLSDKTRTPQSAAQEDSVTDVDLLTYEDEIITTKEPPKSKAIDPLGELPLDMVSYEEKGASR